MKRRQIRSNPAWATMTKKRKEKIEKAGGGELAVRDDTPNQLLSWDGLSAALSFCVPFVVVAATGIQNAVAITAILLAVLLPVGLLRFALREKLDMPGWLAAPICAVTAAGVIAFVALLLRQYLPQVSESLGMYIYLLAAYPVAAAAAYGKKAGKVSTTLAWVLRSVLYMGMFALLAGGLRELLVRGRQLDAAATPFFGFIVLGFVLAGVTALHNMLHKNSAVTAAEGAVNTAEQHGGEGV